MGNRRKLIAKNLTVVYRGRVGVGREGKEIGRTFKDPKEGEAFVKDMRKCRPGVTPRGNVLLKISKSQMILLLHQSKLLHIITWDDYYKLMM